jgi:hypothetical protein
LENLSDQELDAGQQQIERLRKKRDEQFPRHTSCVLPAIYSPLLFYVEYDSLS